MPTFSYKGPYRYHITIHTEQAKPFASAGWDFDIMLSVLSQTSQRYDFKVIVYCFMPNHLHLLLEGNEKSNLIEFLRIFKQISAFHYKKTMNSKLWQRSYFDRVLRREEETAALVKYILENPVRWGLAKEWNLYPYSGSLTVTRDNLRIVF
jgi:putative transposase